MIKFWRKKENKVWKKPVAISDGWTCNIHSEDDLSRYDDLEKLDIELRCQNFALGGYIRIPNCFLMEVNLVMLEMEDGDAIFHFRPKYSDVNLPYQIVSLKRRLKPDDIPPMLQYNSTNGRIMATTFVVLIRLIYKDNILTDQEIPLAEIFSKCMTSYDQGVMD